MTSHENRLPLSASVRVRQGLALLGLLATGQALVAQVPPDNWALGTQYTTVSLFGSSFSPYALLMGANSYGGMAVDDQGVIFNGSGTGVTRIDYDPATNTLSQQILVALLPSFVPNSPGWVAMARNRLWLLGSVGYLAEMDRFALNQRPPVVGNVLTAAGLTGYVRGMCSDGREAFFTIDVSAAYPYHVYAVDLRSSPLAVRPVAALPLGQQSRIGPPLVLGRNGDLLAMDHDSLFRIDPRSGQLTVMAPRPLDPDFTPVDPLFQFAIAYDPWSDRVAVGPAWSPSRTNIYAGYLSTGILSPAWFMVFDGMYKMTSTSEQPFELFGIGCVNGIGREPRLGWQGLPQQSQTFTVTLRDAEPNGVALFWLGLSDTFWAPVGQLPFEATAFGAPGCRLFVAADIPYLAWVDGSGHGSRSIPVPVNPALAGMKVFAQSVSSSTGNALGFAASDALLIRIR